MIGLSQVKRITLLEDEEPWIKKEGEKAAKYGSSSITMYINDPELREKMRVEHNISGAYGEAAIHIYLFEPRKTALDYFKKARDKISKLAEEHPGAGDGGQDILDTNLDIKTTKVHTNQNQRLLDWHLAVPGGEFKRNGWIYVQGLYKELEEEENRKIIYIMGWAYSEEFPKEPKIDEPFKGSFVLRCNKLRPMKTLPDNIFPQELKQYLRDYKNEVSEDGILEM